jgi:hypothetical protein
MEYSSRRDSATRALIREATGLRVKRHVDRSYRDHGPSGIEDLRFSFVRGDADADLRLLGGRAATLSDALKLILSLQPEEAGWRVGSLPEQRAPAARDGGPGPADPVRGPTKTVRLRQMLSDPRALGGVALFVLSIVGLVLGVASGQPRGRLGMQPHYTLSTPFRFVEPTPAPAPVVPARVTAFAIPGAHSPCSIVAGPDHNLWFAECDDNAIGRITPGGAVREFPITIDSDLGGIAAGPDGNLWYAESIGNAVGRITPGGGIMDFWATASGGFFPSDIARGPDGNLWFTTTGGIQRITPRGSVSGYAFPDEVLSDSAGGITLGPDGDLWFLLANGTRLGRCTTSGQISIFSLPGSLAALTSIAAGPDGNLWAADERGQIVRLRLLPAAATPR